MAHEERRLRRKEDEGQARSGALITALAEPQPKTKYHHGDTATRRYTEKISFREKQKATAKATTTEARRRIQRRTKRDENLREKERNLTLVVQKVWFGFS